MIIFKILAWIILAYGVVGFFAYLATKNTKNILLLPFHKIMFFVGIVFLFITTSIVRIDAQEVGVLITPKGVDDKELHTGWHFVWFWNSVMKMDKTVWVYSCTESKSEGAKSKADAIWSPTSDGIKMGFDVSVSWRIDPDMASWIYSNVSENDGGDNGRYLWLEENVIRTKIKSALTQIVSKYTPIQAYAEKRKEIQSQTYGEMKKEILKYHLILDQVDLREVYYNPLYENEINNKKIQEQKALTMMEVTKQKQEELIQAKINKDIQIQKSQGEAEALRIKSNAISSNPRVLQLEWIQQWNGILPSTIVGDSKGMMLMLNDLK